MQNKIMNTEGQARPGHRSPELRVKEHLRQVDIAQQRTQRAV